VKKGKLTIASFSQKRYQKRVRAGVFTTWHQACAMPEIGLLR